VDPDGLFAERACEPDRLLPMVLKAGYVGFGEETTWRFTGRRGQASRADRGPSLSIAEAGDSKLWNAHLG
jgi:hypothetical protein